MYALRSLCSVLLLAVLFASCEKDPELNKVPVANAGPSASITLPVNTVTLTGTGSDADGSIVAYLWSQVSGPTSSLIANPGAASTAVNNLVQGTYVFQLMVTDNGGATGVDTMSVIVNPNPNPIVLTLQPANNPTEKVLVDYNGTEASGMGVQELLQAAWTFNSLPHNARSLLQFDLSSIPSSATIQSARLYLYSNTPPLNGNKVDANFGTNNSISIQRITTGWSPGTAGWYNAPSVTATGQIIIPHTAQSALDLDVDVTGLVATMVNTNANYGFQIRLQNEVMFTSRIFVGSYNTAKASKHPKLVVTYK